MRVCQEICDTKRLRTRVQVYSFVRAVFSQVIPNDFWGSDHNQEVVLKAADKFIRLRRHETMSLQNSIKHFRISDCRWAASSNARAGKVKQYTPLSESNKQHELVYQFLFWVFELFLIPLLKTNFYATESAPFRNKVFYFRHDLWHGLTSGVRANLSATIFRPIDPADSTLDSSRTLGYSYIRLLPKESGLRMITNLRRRFPNKPCRAMPPQAVMDKNKQQNGLSINSILQNAFHVLSYEKTRVPSILGSSVLGLNDIYPKLKAFQAHCRPAPGQAPTKLYFCKVDVTSCFDTIDQRLLLSIVRDIVQDDEYMIQKYSTIYPSAGRLKRSFIRRARPSGEFAQFSELAKSLADGLRNTILVDGVVYTFEERESLLALMEEHICNNLIKMGKKLFRQIVGIPQGSVLSTLLCSLFYAHLEKTKLSRFVSENSLLLRYVDDFLYVTTSKDQAADFLHAMHADISDSLTVDFAKRPGFAFRHKVMQMLKPKCHAIFIDTELNSIAVVLLNIYQNHRMCAAKFVAYQASMPRTASALCDAFYYDVIQEAIRFSYSLIRSRVASGTAVKNHCRCPITAAHVEWLGLTAFQAILTSRQSRFSNVLARIEYNLQAERFRRVRKELAAVVLDRNSPELISIRV
ncbi:hypothetical protein HDU90_007563 [Geranomyces variabilis]|nr:hypothetical protein HDU90_007563 [Geranomyces variabilis]